MFGTHGGTYGGNAVACAAAEATNGVIRDGLLENATKMGTSCWTVCATFRTATHCWVTCAGLGLMIGTSSRCPHGSPAVDLAKQIIARCQAERLLLLSAGTYGNTIRWIPPLIVTPEQIAWSLAIFERALQAAG